MQDIKEKIDLISIFKTIEDESYCIIKLPHEFPVYVIGSDIDIFCYDIKLLTGKILSVLQELINCNISIEITDRGNQVYIDLIQEGIIHFRFDLYGELPVYENVSIKPAFFSSVIESSEIIVMEPTHTKIKVPSIIDENILRYIEYHEWYSERPDKIKHINYIQDCICSEQVNFKNMIDKLHYYTSVPKVFDNRLLKATDTGIIGYLNFLVSNFKRVINHIKSKGFLSTLKKIFKKVFKW